MGRVPSPWRLGVSEACMLGQVSRQLFSQCLATSRVRSQRRPRSGVPPTWSGPQPTPCDVSTRQVWPRAPQVLRGTCVLAAPMDPAKANEGPKPRVPEADHGPEGPQGKAPREVPAPTAASLQSVLVLSLGTARAKLPRIPTGAAVTRAPVTGGGHWLCPRGSQGP